MKAKANPYRHLVDRPGVDDAAEALRLVNHFQSGLRQVCFGLAALTPPEERTPLMQEQLADMHEEEARYHTREAAWLKQTYGSDSGGRGQGRYPTKSSGSRKKAQVSNLVVLDPYEDS